MDIKRIEQGEIITEPGIYDMPLGWYHSDCCDGPSVSSTGLRRIALKSPLHFWDTSYLNPERAPDSDDELEGEHFRLGRAAHYRMLEPALFKANVAVRPERFDSWRTGAAKLWLADAQADGKTVLTPPDMVRVDGIAKALSEHPWHSGGILGGAVETSLVTRDSKTGIWIKSRPDSMPIDGAITDLKCVRDASPRAVSKAIRDLGYDLQFALAGACWFNLTGETLDQFWLVAVESSRPHAIHVASLSTASTYWARIRLRQALDTMAACLKSGDWPSYGADGLEHQPAPYEAERWEAEQKSGLLPKEDEF